jgi:hypothetical protein
MIQPPWREFAFARVQTVVEGKGDFSAATRMNAIAFSRRMSLRNFA